MWSSDIEEHLGNDFESDIALGVGLLKKKKKVTNNSKLKPCPFCGEEDLGIERKGLFYVTCYKCDCEGPATKDKQQAIDAWNKRS